MLVVWRWPYKTQNKIFENTITYVIFNIGFKIVPFPICRWDEMKEFLKKLCFIGRGRLYVKKKFLPESIWKDSVDFGVFLNLINVRVFCTISFGIVILNLVRVSLFFFWSSPNGSSQSKTSILLSWFDFLMEGVRLYDKGYDHSSDGVWQRLCIW